MSQFDFEQILARIGELTPDQVRMIRIKLAQLGLAKPSPNEPPLTEKEQADRDMQLKLVAAGLMIEIKPPIRDPERFRDRKAVPILGEPLSVTVIRERR